MSDAPECFSNPKYDLIKIKNNRTYRVLSVPEKFNFLNKAKLQNSANDEDDEYNLSPKEKSKITDGGGAENAEKYAKNEEEIKIHDDENDLFFDKNEQKNMEESSASCNFEVAKCLIKFLIGKNGKTKLNFENQFGIKIHVDNAAAAELNEEEEKEKKKEKNEEKDTSVITLTLNNKNNNVLLTAKEQILKFLAKEAERLPFTHFICLPLSDENIIKTYETFTKLILDEKYDDIDSTVFIDGKKLHFTLIMLRLLTKQEIKKCMQILDDACPHIYDAVRTQSLLVELEGVHIMNDDPTCVDVVYTTIAKKGGETNANNAVYIHDVKTKINKICEILVERLIKEDLITDISLHKQKILDSSGKNIQLNLHATLMNTKYKYNILEEIREGEEKDKLGIKKTVAAPPDVWKNRKKMNVEKMLKKYKTFFFGKVKVEKICLNELGVTEADGNYKTVKYIYLP